MKKNNRIFLVLNSGSSSEKFSLYDGDTELASLYFEGIEEDGKKKFICTLTKPDGTKKEIEREWETLDVAFRESGEIFRNNGFGGDEGNSLDGVLVRVVATGDYFAHHHIVDEQIFAEFDKVKKPNCLHVPGALREIKNATETFVGVPVLAMSDSEALVKTSRRDLDYALPKKVHELAGIDIRRYGAHGSSHGYIAQRMAELKLPEAKGRVAVCHLGSGCSITLFINGEPVLHSMGFTPLEGLMSSTRTGSMDPSIGALLAEKLGSVTKAIEVMNKESGLLAIVGTDDMREVIAGAEKGHPAAVKAYDMFIRRISSIVGAYAAEENGLDAIVFTATIGERSAPVRNSIIAKLKFLGFEIDDQSTIDPTKDYANVAKPDSKPVYIIPANESAYMIKKANELLDQEK